MANADPFEAFKDVEDDPEPVPGELAKANGHDAGSDKAAPAPTPGQRLLQEGLEALVEQDKAGALAKFTEAWKFQDQLDPDSRQQLKDKLTFLRAIDSAKPLAGGEPPSPLEQVNSQQE